MQAEDGIEAMMTAAGFERKEEITWEDFRFLLRDHENELQFAHLNVKGQSPISLRVDLSKTGCNRPPCVGRDGETGMEASQPRPEGVFHLSGQQVRGPLAPIIVHHHLHPRLCLQRRPVGGTGDSQTENVGSPHV